MTIYDEARELRTEVESLREENERLQRDLNEALFERDEARDLIAKFEALAIVPGTHGGFLLRLPASEDGGRFLDGHTEFADELGDGLYCFADAGWARRALYKALDREDDAAVILDDTFILAGKG